MRDVDVILVTHNSQRDIAECVDALLAQRGVNLNITVVDNASSDQTLEILRARFPEIRILTHSRNLGYSRACNTGLRFLSNDYVAFVNPDNIGDSNWIVNAVGTLEENPTAGGCQARLLLYSERSRLNSRGNQANILFFGWPDGHLELDDVQLSPVRIPFASGGASVYTRECIERVGGYNEAQFLYSEDLELGLRAFLFGYEVILSPNSIVYHKYEFKPSPEKYGYLETGRMLVLIEMYGWRAVILMSPLYLLTELAVLAKAAAEGWLSKKLRSYFSVLTNLDPAMRRRREVQRGRTRSDKELIGLLKGGLYFSPLESSRILTVGNTLFEKYRSFLLTVAL